VIGANIVKLSECFIIIISVRTKCTNTQKRKNNNDSIETKLSAKN